MYGNYQWATGEVITATKMNGHTMVADNPFYLPPYYKANFDAAIDGIMSDIDRDTFSFMFATDIHADTATKLENVIALGAYIKSLPLDCVILGGDYFEGNLIKSSSMKKHREVFQIIRKEVSDIPLVIVKGNHDTNTVYATAQGVPAEMISNKEWYAHAVKYTEQYSNVFRDISNPYGGYYYLEFESKKIRVVVLNNCEAKQDANGIPNDLASLYVSSAQYKWFAEVALNLSGKAVPTDWHVMVVSHSQPVLSALYHDYAMDDAVIEAIEIAFKTGVSYTNVTHGISINYTTQGTGNFIAHVAGHCHIDSWHAVNNINYVTVECTAPSQKWNTAPVSAVRATYSESMNSCGIITINRAAKTVSHRKIGAGTSAQFTY